MELATARRSDSQVSPSGGHRSAVVASFLGWTLDAFDFFLVTLALGRIAEDFHTSRPDIALSLTLTLAFRPVGAFIFGLLADRVGRRLPLMIDLVFYSVFEVLTGLAPNYWSFMVCRAMFGIGMGGEWGVGATLAMEKVPPRLRGVLSGLLQQGYAAGNLLAAMCAYFVMPRFGWRIMFFIGGLPALLALYVRRSVKESEVWENTKKHESWGHLGLAIASHWKSFIYLVLLIGMMGLVSHGTQDLYPTFLQKQWTFSEQQSSLLTAFTMVGALAGGIFFGFLSDRSGRRKAMMIALAVGIATIPIWALSASTAQFLAMLPPMALMYIGGFLMQFMVQGAWGVIPAHLAELSPDSVRGFLPGFAYQCGVLLSSPVAFRQAKLGEAIGYGRAMALTAVIIFSLAIVVIAVGRERHGIRFGQGSA
jgi:SHS family lactate transporter-like MFS transporter